MYRDELHYYAVNSGKPHSNNCNNDVHIRMYLEAITTCSLVVISGTIQCRRNYISNTAKLRMLLLLLYIEQLYWHNYTTLLHEIIRKDRRMREKSISPAKDISKDVLRITKCASITKSTLNEMKQSAINRTMIEKWRTTHLQPFTHLQFN